jgi:FAD dependent oxidoreductase
MRKNNSPWLHQLVRARDVNTISLDMATDIAVIGGGIAGMITAYNILKLSDMRVTLIEADLVGHGASGHNAGQLTTYFERPLADIATEYGVKMACEGQRNVESSWSELENIIKEIKLETPVYRFTGYAGMTELKHVLLHLADNMIRYDGDIPVERMLISNNFKFLDQIPSIYSHLFEIADHEMILNLLETNNPDYIATLAYPKGATNSAKICEELANYLLSNYKNRFEIFENSPVKTINLYDDKVLTEIEMRQTNPLLDTNNKKYIITSQKLILCTNGFEGFEIVNNSGADIDGKFHHEVSGLVNYMSAYIDELSEDPVAVSYFPKSSRPSQDEERNISGEPYFYMTRRPHKHEDKEMGLISTGGPERILNEDEKYDRDSSCDLEAEKEIDNFLKKNYKKHKQGTVNYDFCWHGLLGYTTNGIRLIGVEPRNKNLLYNLGCNGIGIMPAIFAGNKIARIIKGEKFDKSIFDPKP